MGGQFGDVEWVTVQVGFAPKGTRGGLLSEQSCRSHLSARHAVDGVVDKHDGDVFPSVEGVDGLRRTDAGQVAVALIGEYQSVGPQPFDGGSQCRSPAVRGLLPVDVKIAVGKHRAAHRTHPNGLFAHAHVFYHLGHELVYHSVAASRTVVHGGVVHQRRLLIDDVFRGYDVFFCIHSQMSLCCCSLPYSGRLLSAFTISSGSGTMPPKRPK